MIVFGAILLTLQLATLTLADAAVIVDQSQLAGAPSGTAGSLSRIAEFSQNDLAQSFRPTLDNITGARVHLWGGSDAGIGSGNITIELFSALPNDSGVMLGSGTSNSVSPGQYAVVDFGSVSVVPDQTLYLVFTSTNDTLALSGSVNDPYSRGNTFANTGYMAFPNFDYTFETFGASAVPEPSAFALLGIGACAAIARRRRLIPTAAS
ncbi:PEP-CTERM sorting domain-containing protein [Rhodopirellula bahusiensis]|uniref:PEP-CTERM sorting domain-containing protein n=1 Tax=Rhodopirellula bahusiensis TaxID=2014065 RepID=A0A2G1W2Y0_9BACT|nr:PEP-CTERM sorting domain-containing protein [Rhodopirellula bahusiensis]